MNAHSLPADAAGRVAAHDELHARPVTPVRVPALITQLTVLAAEDSAAAERARLRELAAGHEGRSVATDTGLTVDLPGGATLAWEPHGDYAVYTVHQGLDGDPGAAGEEPDLLSRLPLPAGWLAAVPGRTVSAVQLVLLPSAATAEPGEQGPGEQAPGEQEPDEHGPNEQEPDEQARAQCLLGPGRLLGSQLKEGSARLWTTYRLRPDGTSRFLLVTQPWLSEGRTGRIAASLLDAERYRVLALLAYPVARRRVPLLDRLEEQLARLTHLIEDAAADDRSVLDDLISLAAQVETEIAAHAHAFEAARAYHAIARQRIEDLRDTSVPGLTGVFTFLDRRLVPAMATVTAVERRTDEISERIARTADLLRTRVEVSTESSSHDLLREIRRGQAVQLRLQETVEGLSVVAISYYAVGLVGYLLKGVKAGGVHLNVEAFTAVALPLVLLAVWLLRRRISRLVHGDGSDEGHD